MFILTQNYLFILTQRRRERRVHTENYIISHRKHGNHRNLNFKVIGAKALA